MSLAQAMQSPSKYFETPHEVVISEDFTTFEKDKILKNWRQSLIQETRASYEGMETEKDKDLLAELNTAMRKVKVQRENTHDL